MVRCQQCLRQNPSKTGRALAHQVAQRAGYISRIRDEHRRLAREAAARSMVLLKNEQNLLPLQPKVGLKIALIGRLVNQANTGDRGSSWILPGKTIGLELSSLDGDPNALSASVFVVCGQSLRTAHHINSGMVGLTTILFLVGVLDFIPTGAAKWIQASLTVVYSFVYFLTLGAMAFVLLGEVSSPVLRAKTTALATATQAILGIIMFFAVPCMVDPDEANLRGKVSFIFGGMSAVAANACFFLIPELKVRTVQEIDAMFHKRIPLQKMGFHSIEKPYDDEMK